MNHENIRRLRIAPRYLDAVDELSVEGKAALVTGLIAYCKDDTRAVSATGLIGNVSELYNEICYDMAIEDAVGYERDEYYLVLPEKYFKVFMEIKDAEQTFLLEVLSDVQDGTFTVVPPLSTAARILLGLLRDDRGAWKLMHRLR